MMSEYDLGLRFHKQPRSKRPTPERSELGNLILTMTDKEIFNTFASVIDCPRASAFLKRLAQAGLVAMPQDKALILKTWPRLFMQYGPHTKGYKNS
tara:strand:- start:1211 stop:1498 length:288 start_codon:yes stop_codon:yes gene_type:complete